MLARFVISNNIETIASASQNAIRSFNVKVHRDISRIQT